MVEYAVLLAHNTVGSFNLLSGQVSSWAAHLDSSVLLYGLLGLVLARVVFGAFVRSRQPR
jgi:hypothetical protein